jgi:hypothetical protein
MNMTLRLLAKLGILPLLAVLSTGSVSAQTDAGKAILEKLTAKVAKVESACSKDIKKYCSNVTPGEGRIIYCMQAYEDKISPKCVFELEEAETSVLTTADALKDAVIACKAEITGCVRQDTAGPGTNRGMPVREQVDCFNRVRGSHQENRDDGCSITLCLLRATSGRSITTHTAN